MTIFLAGVHGVGKSYLADRIAAQIGLIHVAASRIIEEERGRASWSADKLVAEIDENQQALISAVGRRRESGQRVLLNGHFVLRGTEGQLTPIGAAVFAKLHISKVILLEAPPEVVAQRLATRGDGRIASNVVSDLLRLEREHARKVCSVLGIPLITLECPSEEDFRLALQS